MTQDQTAQQGPGAASSCGEPDPGHPVGSLAEEASKLAAAFATWATTQSGKASHHVHDLAGAVADGTQEWAHEWAEELDEHLATGAAECTVCPVCRAVSAVREVSPEVKEHLTAAAGSLVAAASGLLSAFAASAARPHPGAAECAGEQRGASAGRPGGEPVQRIDLDG